MRSDLSYGRYSRAAWGWWCDRHDADFVVLEAPPSEPVYAQMMPTMQRWAVLHRLLSSHS